MADDYQRLVLQHRKLREWVRLEKAEIAVLQKQIDEYKQKQVRLQETIRTLHPQVREALDVLKDQDSWWKQQVAQVDITSLPAFPLNTLMGYLQSQGSKDAWQMMKQVMILGLNKEKPTDSKLSDRIYWLHYLLTNQLNPTVTPDDQVELIRLGTPIRPSWISLNQYLNIALDMKEIFPAPRDLETIRSKEFLALDWSTYWARSTIKHLPLWIELYRVVKIKKQLTWPWPKLKPEINPELWSKLVEGLARDANGFDFPLLQALDFLRRQPVSAYPTLQRLVQQKLVD